MCVFQFKLEKKNKLKKYRVDFSYSLGNNQAEDIILKTIILKRRRVISFTCEMHSCTNNERKKKNVFSGCLHLCDLHLFSTTDSAVYKTCLMVGGWESQFIFHFHIPQVRC